MRAALESRNGMLAIKLGGRGDMTATNLLWEYNRAVPQLPSPLLYNGILYMVNDGGVVTSFRPGSGEVIAQGRLKGAVDQYYASPVAADGKIFMLSELGMRTQRAPSQRDRYAPSVSRLNWLVPRYTRLPINGPPAARRPTAVPISIASMPCASSGGGRDSARTSA